jgi:hypothetical protein
MAKKAQGTAVYVSTATAAGKVISGITQANPAVVSCVGHGFTDGDVVWISGVGGMQQVNNRAFIVDGVTDSPTTGVDAFKLKGVNSTNYTAFAGTSPQTGTAALVTMASVGEVTGIPEMGGTEPNEIDVSHLQSIASEKLAGLPRQSNVSFNVWFDLATSSHKELLLANEDLADRVFRFSQATWDMTIVGQVGGFRVTAGDVNSAISGTVTLLPRGAGAWAEV